MRMGGWWLPEKQEGMERAEGREEERGGGVLGGVERVHWSELGQRGGRERRGRERRGGVKERGGGKGRGIF